MNTIQFKKLRILITFITCFFCLMLFVKYFGAEIAASFLRVSRSEAGLGFTQIPDDLHLQKNRLEDDLEMPRDEDVLRPGDAGKPVKMTPEEEQKSKDTWYLNEFNSVAAAKMPLDRTLPDFRHELCKGMTYNLTHLPKTSIIVIFHNEEYHTVLRTATSCYNRSPPHLLQEIILVDDFSDRDELKQPLEEYVKSHFNGKVKVVRTPSRHGLIRAKNFGSKFAQGEALVFLDSHCECTKGWLPPLLQALKDNPKTVVQPVIPGIDQQTLSFRHSEKTLSAQGTFEWSLLFYWRSIPEHDQKIRTSKVDRIRSPTLAGGLFCLMRSWWEYLGRYDDGMELWGGENLELSFKTWLCGGKVEYIPCSHVGHIYRGKHPYHWYKPGPDRAFTTNARRLAEVWLDEYKRFFYELAPDAKKLDMGDISEQLANKERLNCKPFKYFLTDVVRDMYVPTILNKAQGSLKLSETRVCLDTMNKKEGEVPLLGCHGQGGNQAVSLSEIGEIRMNIQICLDVDGPNKALLMAKCNGSKNQMWIHEGMNSPIKHKVTGQCITHIKNQLRMQDCSDSDRNQNWAFDLYFDPPQ